MSRLLLGHRALSHYDGRTGVGGRFCHCGCYFTYASSHLERTLLNPVKGARVLPKQGQSDQEECRVRFWKESSPPPILLNEEMETEW